MLYITILLAGSLKTFAQEVFVIDGSSHHYRIDKYVDVFIDSTSVFSFNEIQKSSIQNSFNRRNKPLTFGYLESNIWLRIALKNSLPEKTWLLEIPAPFLEYVDFYQNENGNWRIYESGYYRPYSLRQIKDTGHTLKLSFDQDSEAVVYVCIKGTSPKTFPMYVWEESAFHDKTRIQDVGYGIFFGILIVMFFYNLVLFLTLKQVNYLLYILTIICTLLIFAAASGYGGKFLWPSHPHMNYYAGRLTLPAVTIILSIFTIRFLEVKRFSKIIYYILLVQIVLAVIAFILITTKVLSSAGNHLISLSTIIYIITGIVCSIKGNKIAYYFIAAWIIYLIGGLLLSLRNSGFLEFNFLTTHFVEIGAAMETIIIALALGDQYRRYKLEKEEAQLEALKIQKEANEKLEHKVRERTEELQSMLEMNKMQTQIIEDKNAELDSFFYRISHDLKGPISSLLGLTSLAKKEINEPIALDYIEKQHQQVERLKNIISGLIKLTKLNDAQLQMVKIDFEKMIDEVIHSSSGLPNFNKVRFIKEIGHDIHCFSEWTLLTAIFQNLIENAVKYAVDTNPFVRISVNQAGENVIIEVEDNGQGISEEHQSRIFDVFYRATQSSAGSGLGLYILKRSLDKLNGSITIKSSEAKGSTFIVTLPAHKP